MNKNIKIPFTTVAEYEMWEFKNSTKQPQQKASLGQPSSNRYFRQVKKLISKIIQKTPQMPKFAYGSDQSVKRSLSIIRLSDDFRKKTNSGSSKLIQI